MLPPLKEFMNFRKQICGGFKRETVIRAFLRMAFQLDTSFFRQKPS